jgi:hypothetical protein
MHGVTDYDWSKWDPKAVPLTDDLKKQAADIVDKFTTSTDYQKWADTDTSASLMLRFVVQYASERKFADLNPTPTGSGIINWAQWEKTRTFVAPVVEEKKETPWLLYAAGAAALFLLLRK